MFIKENTESAFMFLELILIIAMITLIFYIIFNFYFKKTPLEEIDKEALQDMKVITEHIDNKSYNSMVDSTRKRLEELQEQRLRYLDEIR